MSGRPPTLAVIPAAGLGTRLRPLTDVVPKEMLTLGRLPVLGHVLSEMRDAGIPHVTVVVSPAKDLVRRYLAGVTDCGLEITVAVQEAMRGVGDAVLTGIPPGYEGSVLAAFGDCVILRPPRVGVGLPNGSADAVCAGLPARRLLDAFVRADAQAAVLCERVPLDRVHLYGVLEPSGPEAADADGPFEIRGIVEKPSVETAPSTWVVAARWALGPEAVALLRRQPPGKGGEIGVTEAIAELLRQGGRVVAVPLAKYERRCDVGNWKSLLSAQALAAAWDEQHGTDIIEELQGRGATGRQHGNRRGA